MLTATVFGGLSGEFLGEHVARLGQILIYHVIVAGEHTPCLVPTDCHCQLFRIPVRSG